MKTVLSIAGSDSSGGAGIQADIKTMQANGVYAMTAITALTAQNTLGVNGIFEIPAEFLEKQLESIFQDIYPDAIKIGMLSSSNIIKKIAEILQKYHAKSIVLDPVMVATSGSPLIKKEAIQDLEKFLFPLATLITPNIPETELLSGISIKNEQDMERAAKKLGEKYHCSVLCKGGHQKNTAHDLLFDKGTYTWFYGEKIDNPNTHGTGCTLSSAIASNLAKEYTLEQAIQRAKNYVSSTLESTMNLGQGSGPLDHGFDLSSPFIEK
ncbi:bifunctional hydroxymethylpyrimidine kinase/phosphomethylpyrimidine kinase [Fusobacterium gonidiaformans]|uniref:bifunctional hydroxymethylpyrimidine kinase/phosphomethylpyrimidine kinase n=1 Tax=Fusobacterium gonidiaformans TaxID=849 RepID=UPI0001BC645D|nr:bifunctional hydroxymethylpyrimidine kinase/phosphomethylpyrimidine kinase [Fusobacterium gonidiaformans]AVQ16714.1 bifunctional hydroxymethylpyrimidine kinase/phosphomethylpyrimidine kinase [Fusobacterium gonidiaformans ATCC 25563]